MQLSSHGFSISYFRDECKNQIEKFSGAAFKKFNTEKECQQFIAEKSGSGASTSTEQPVKPTIIPNAVAYKALTTKPSGSKIGSTTRKSTKFTAPQKQSVPSSSSNDEVDRAFLANLGGCLKRRSTNYHDTRKTKLGRYDFDTDPLGYVQVYTDGSCVNNGKKDARAGLGVYFGEDHPL